MTEPVLKWNEIKQWQRDNGRGSHWQSGQWEAHIYQTISGKFVATLELDVLIFDELTIEKPKQLETFPRFEADALDRFSVWLAKNGDQALNEWAVS